MTTTKKINATTKKNLRTRSSAVKVISHTHRRLRGLGDGMTDVIDTAHMTDAEYREYCIEDMARDCADAAWRAGLDELIKNDAMEYHHFTLTSLDIAWIEGEEECADLTDEEIAHAQEVARDRLAELHAENGGCK